MDTTALLQALPDKKGTHIYLLFEAGAQITENFRIFQSEHASYMYSLYIHPQLEEFQEYGPWLLEAKNKTQLLEYLENLPGIIGVIVANRHLSSVAIQLSRGCVAIGPENKASLIRYYAQQVLKVLVLSAENDWHAFLFRDIGQWWVPGNEQWEQINIPTSTASNPMDHVVRLDKEVWQQITDKAEISSILTQWQKMPSSQHFPHCTQRDMVIKALRKAKEASIPEGTDSKLYALYYLNGGKMVLESDEMQISLQQVSLGKISLEQLLAKFTA
ncbi:DUF4123 domain-containing protein [Dryocola sp. BD626]|uniref:DUF4123 domain-containing protein n=1 Tax=Dryocola sp. BD626 TaxID=3133273 RepID=UPI003F501969